MSAGQNLRRGYAYGVSSAVHSGSTIERRAPPDVLSLIMLATLVVVIAAVASNPVLAASIERILGTAWSESLGFLLRVVSPAS
jgi:hypothetical protein